MDRMDLTAPTSWKTRLAARALRGALRRSA